jgi:hypothetical protein
MTTKIDFNEYTLGLSGGTPPNVESWKITIFHSVCGDKWWSLEVQFPELEKSPTAVAEVFSSIVSHHIECKGGKQEIPATDEFFGELDEVPNTTKTTFLVIPSN